MMVEAEATTETIELVAGGAQAPTEDVVAQGLEAAKPFIRSLCVAQQQLADVAAKPTGDFPTFPAYQSDVLDAVTAHASDDLGRRWRSPASRSASRASTRSRPRCWRRSAPQFEGREKEIGAAFRSLNKKLVRRRILPTRSASTAVGSPTSGRSRPRSRSSRGRTARRCSSAARPRSWASPR